MRPSAATISAALHGAALLGLWFLFQAGLLHPPSMDPVRSVEVLIAPYRWARAAGGGQRETLPAGKGRLPPRAATRVFVLPTAHILNDHPLLPVPQALLLDSDPPVVAIDRIGNPFGKDGPLSGGHGGPGGIGEGGCCGVGNQSGPGLEGTVQPLPSKPKQLRNPVLLHKIEPEYSEEARKAKLQGVVVIMAEIDTLGRARQIRVVRSLGLGLDEKAVDATAQWRFRPATADGRPVASSVTIEVNFRLL